MLHGKNNNNQNKQKIERKCLHRKQKADFSNILT